VIVDCADEQCAHIATWVVRDRSTRACDHHRSERHLHVILVWAGVDDEAIVATFFNLE